MPQTTAVSENMNKLKDKQDLVMKVKMRKKNIVIVTVFYILINIVVRFHNIIHPLLSSL